VTAVLYNPYIFGPPIRRPEDFFGREEETYSLLECIRNAGCASVVGERRMGKTSLLYNLMNQPQGVWQKGAEPLPVLIDPQLRIRGEKHFCAKVIQEIASEIPELTPAAREPREQAEETDLIAYLEKIAPRRLVLMIDEFELIATQEGFSEQFFLFLRAIAQNYGASLITATSVPLEQCCRKSHISSVFRNIFQDVYLKPFSEEAFQHFIAETSRRSGVSLEIWRPQILDLAGRFPAFTQLACLHYYRAAARKPDLSPDEHLKIRQSFEDQAKPCFESIWEEYLSDEEKVALKDLAKGQADMNSSAMKQLMRKGYVVDNRVFSSVFAEMFLREREIRPISSSPIFFDEKGEIWVNGKLTPPLTKNEYTLLKYLCQNVGKTCTKDEVAAAVWSDDYSNTDDQRIAQLVSRLRRKIEPDPNKPRYLLTSHGRGFKLIF